MIYRSENVLESFWLQPTKNPSTIKQTMWMEKNHGLLSCQKKKPWHLADLYSFAACSPVSSCLTCSPVHVELAQTQTATELLHVFGTFWGISVKRFTILKCSSLLYASTVPHPSSGAVMFGFRRHVWFSRQPPDSLQQRDACKRNQSAALPQSFLLFAEGAEGGSQRNQSGLRQHCCCMVKHRGAPTVRYSFYMFTQEQIKIIWASPEGERLVSRAGLQQLVICWWWPQHTFVPFKSRIVGSITGFTGTTCYLAPSVGRSCWKP